MALVEGKRVTMLRSLWSDIQRAPKDAIVSYRLAQSVLSSVSSNGNVFRRILKDVFLAPDNQIENTAKKISMKTNTQLNLVYLGYKEFKQSFHDPTKEFFKKLHLNVE